MKLSPSGEGDVRALAIGTESTGEVADGPPTSPVHSVSVAYARPSPSPDGAGFVSLGDF
mgnify:CR=1 FL=1